MAAKKKPTRPKAPKAPRASKAANAPKAPKAPNTVKVAVVARMSDSESKSKGKSNGKGKSSPLPPAPSLVPSVLLATVAFLCAILLGRGGENSSASDVTLPFPLPAFPLPEHVPCTSSNLEQYLHAAPVHGLHVVCVEPLMSDDEGEARRPPDASEMRRRLVRGTSLRLTFYPGSHAAPPRPRVTVSGSNAHEFGGVASVAWEDVKTQLVEGLGLAPEGPTQQPWAVFTSRGERIVGENDRISSDAEDTGSNTHILRTIAASEMLVISQGGTWLWPPVREGFTRTIALAQSKVPGASTAPRNVTIETLSLKPLVVSIQGFLTDDECDYIARKAAPSMQYSGVSLKDADKGKAASEWRTSQSAFLSANDDPLLRDLEHRVGSLTRVPASHQEYVQVLRYGTSEKYDSHHDYFDAAAYRSDPNTLNLIQHGKRNRFATVFWYLTTVDEGGHTIFPRAGGLPPVRNHADCSRGLKVQPQKGKVIIFYSLDATGAMDPLSLHGACPVGENNVKWAANKWIWNAPMSFVGE